ncbi:YkvI family membrane protein [Salinicoccus roseus]|uniref:Membrane protein n=1 Tax=Salinicoccus roseus TaxID=45670 RepID=A0A0C2H7D8_9STAP|nr:membrane protein [Salinicoccus roseus]KIH69790.1 membrane protein [Salinicoccus roseus]MDB0579243.1 hypothetical protein [Salinicoccus roseus]
MSSQQEPLKIGFAYVGVVLGAGFSTGQEMLQFFTNYGTMSYWAVILSGLVIMFIGRQASKLGNRLEAESHLEPINEMFGERLGKIIDYILIFFLYGVMVIMLAGAGSAFHESFGIPSWLGSLILAVAVFITLNLSFNKILVALGAVTPFLIAFVMIIAAYSFLNPSVPFSEANTYTDVAKSPSGVWWWDALTYSGIVLAMAFSLLSIMGSQASGMKAARKGGLFGGIMLLVLLILLNGGLLARIDVTNAAEIPSLILAREIHPILGLGLSLVMLLVIYNTAVGMLYPFLTRFSDPYSKRYRILLGGGLVIGYFLSLVGFVGLVNFFYPILGYVGLLLGAALTVRWLRSKFAVKQTAQ